MNSRRKRKDGILEVGGKFHAVAWHVDERGKRIKKEKTFVTKTLARQWRNSFKTDAARGEIGITSARVTMRQIADRYLIHCEDYYRSKYEGVRLQINTRLSAPRCALNSLCDLVGNDKRVIKLTVEDFDSWKRLQKAKGVGNKAINDRLQHIRRCLEMARVFFPELKRWHTPQIESMPKSKKRRKRTLSLTEEAALYEELQKIDPEVADYFLLLMDTALREMDAMRLRTSQIILDDPRFPFGLIDLSTAKTEEPILIPLTQSVREILERRMQGEYVFSFAGRAATRLSHIFIKAAKGAGIPYGRKVANGFYIHDIRRTAINRMLERTGYDYTSVAAIVGASPAVLLQHYTRPDESQMLRAVLRDPLIKALKQDG